MVLIEREAELALIAGLLERAGQSCGGTLILCGEPGVGKTALLRRAVASAPGRTLWLRGVESERELAFVGLWDLLGPVLDLADDLPDPQRRAVLGALAIRGDVPVERFAVNVGVLTLLIAAARTAPLLIVGDDVQWIDDASLDVLRFVTRRIAAEPIAMLLSSREVPPGFDDERTTVRTVRGLTAGGVRTLVGDRSLWADAAAFAEGLHEATGGNPLALGELLRGGGEQLREAVELGQPLPVNDVIRAAFRERLARLSDRARTALLVAAATERRDLAVLARAAAHLGVDLDAFEEAEREDVIAIEEGRVSFQHPIMRSVMYSVASAEERRAAHVALAREIASESNSDEAPWHRAAAALLPDERIASELEETALRYGRRSGHYAAARALQRAAMLTAEDDARARRLHEAAEAARRAGRGAWARRLLDEAASYARAPELQAEVDFTRTILGTWTEATLDSSRRYEELATAHRERDPEYAATVYGYAAAQRVVEGDVADARRQAELAVDAAASEGVSDAARDVAMQALAITQILNGDPAGAETSRRVAREMLGREDLTGREYLTLPLIWIEDYELASALLEPRLAEARATGNLRALTASLEVEANLCFRTGDWQHARAAADESARLAEDSDQTVQLAYSLATLAIVEAAQGRDEARVHAARAEAIGAEYGLAELEQYVATALGLLELGLGDAAAATVSLGRAAAYAARAGQREPCVHQWMADLLDAAFLDGDRTRVEAVIAELSGHAGRPWAQAVALRGSGMLADSERSDAAFGEAVVWHERTTAPFERGRLHLWWGRRLRRDRRRVQAREQLERALEIFDALGARPWSESARKELAASGARLRTAHDSRDELTPQEIQISEMVVAGASNKEIAGTMYLSPKTVETHLSRIYRKLDVRSRQQLAVKLLASRD